MIENRPVISHSAVVPQKDPRIDDYIAQSADFAKPVLARVRKLIHAACPNVEETIKWSFPFYTYQGVLAGTPAFKRHCALIFWKGKFILGKDRKKFMRLTSSADLPGDKILLGYIRKAVELNKAGTKTTKRRKTTASKVSVPSDVIAAFAKNKKSLTTFEALSSSHRREYIEWITQAKREETRIRRIQTAVKWLAKGKSFNWKYR